MDKQGFVYILTNSNNSTFYIGVTSNLNKRMFEHISEGGSEFTTKYKLKKLIYVESTSNILDAIKREKQLKNWHREWKINLIKEKNPDFKDLLNDWYGTEIDSEINSE